MTRAGVWLTAIPVALIVVFAQSALWTDAATDSSRQTSVETGRLSRPAQYVDALGADVVNLNPVLYADATSGRVIEQVFEGLLSYDESLELVPALARSYRLHHDAWLPVHGERCDELVPAAQADPGFPAVDESAVVPAAAAPAHLAAAADDDATASSPRTAAPEQYVYLRLPAIAVDLDTLLRPALSRFGESCRALGPVLHRPVVTFELRDDVRWHDGEPFDAADVRFTYDAIMDEDNRSPRRADYVPIAALETPSAHEVVVTYDGLYSPGVLVWGIGLLPEHRLNDEALAAETAAAGKEIGFRDSAFNRAPVGTGPYKFARWAREREVSLIRNEDYWRDSELPATRPGEALAGMTLRVMPDKFAEELEFKAGGLDAYEVQPHQVARYRAEEDAQVVSGPGFSYAYIGYNLRRPPFDDVRVRRALGMAIKVDDIIEYVLYGEGERTTGPYARETPWYNHDVPPLPYDPAGARALLKEAGYERDGDGWLVRGGERLEFNLITNNGNEKRKAIVSIVQDAWQAIGVKVDTQLLEWSVFLKDYVNVGEFDALVLGWRMTPDFDLYQLWHSSQTGPRQLNFTGYERPQADALIESLRRQYSGDAHRAGAHALHALIAEDQPYTFLYSVKRTTAFAADLSEIAPDGRARPLVASNTGSRTARLWRWRRAPVLTP